MLDLFHYGALLSGPRIIRYCFEIHNHNQVCDGSHASVYKSFHHPDRAAIWEEIKLFKPSVWILLALLLLAFPSQGVKNGNFDISGKLIFRVDFGPVTWSANIVHMSDWWRVTQKHGRPSESPFFLLLLVNCRIPLCWREFTVMRVGAQGSWDEGKARGICSLQVLLFMLGIYNFPSLVFVIFLPLS